MEDLALEPALNRDARRAVIDYYDQCHDDYRILWRTDENGSIHFGYFDDPAGPRGIGRLVDVIHSGSAAALGLVSAATAGGAALTGTAWGRRRATDLLRLAARGRAARHDAAQTRMTEVCGDAVGLRAGDRVLDAGCGVGGTALWLAAHYGVSVIGVNVQPKHLREARARAARHDAGSRLLFSAQDFTELGIRSEAVDVVWALESVCHASDKAGFVREAYRVLRPGGRLMMADFFLPTSTLTPEEQSHIDEWTSGWALPSLAVVPDLQKMFAAVGFQNISFRDVRLHVLPSSRRLYKASLVARPVDVVLERMGARSQLQGRNIRAAFRQYLTLRAGTWTYGIFVAQK